MHGICQQIRPSPSGLRNGTPSIPDHAKQKGESSPPDRDMAFKMQVQSRDGGKSKMLPAHRLMHGHLTVFVITNGNRLVLCLLIVCLPMHHRGSDTQALRVNRLPQASSIHVTIAMPTQRRILVKPNDLLIRQQHIRFHACREGDS
eukprot:600977-Amphidinium_carterae.1